jgi:hypothetical protein
MTLPEDLEPNLEIDPVVSLRVPQPATLAAIVIATVARSSLFPVAFIELPVNICAGSPIHLRGHPKASADQKQYSVNPNGWLILSA